MLSNNEVILNLLSKMQLFNIFCILDGLSLINSYDLMIFSITSIIKLFLEI